MHCLKADISDRVLLLKFSFDYQRQFCELCIIAVIIADNNPQITQSGISIVLISDKFSQK